MGYTEDMDGVTIVQMQLSNGIIVRSNARTPVDAMFTEVFRSDAYVPPGMPQLGPDGTIVDIGASIGLYTLMAARRWPHALIHAVEPAPDTFGLLVANVDENSLTDRVVCHKVAVTDRIGTAPLSLAQTSACDTLLPQGTNSGQRCWVETTTLDALFHRLPPSGGVHMKVDAEGSEFDMFEAASPATLSRISFLTLECHDYLVPALRVASLRRRLQCAGLELSARRTNDELLIYGWRAGT
jgi:FkbM family methyltransferase